MTVLQWTEGEQIAIDAERNIIQISSRKRDQFAYELQETTLGRTIIFVSILKLSSSQALPILAVSMSDAPKPSSKYAIQALQKMGIEVNMMTGDGKITALAIAKQVGIRPEGVWAGMSPKGKATMVIMMVTLASSPFSDIKPTRTRSCYRRECDDDSELQSHDS
ncbi:hypothetical protein B0H17DRAFT_1148685 [Mycena rosella]|uniref:P-type Cu(+) transporter n=1 Tax=Mycena rosella TaxID=1033263 RepID=A0AAD7C9E6_MYCRO|nr:hypothetical protein B0H17DRAFT_1148685 [Mycena rosella]